MLPRLSFIVPVYNTERYLVSCLESILKLRFSDFEIIVVNDCSPGACSNIVKELMKKDERINLLENSNNLGTFLTRKAGVEKAKGEYIAFVDSDDVLLDRKYLDELFNSDVVYDAYHIGVIRFKGNVFKHLPFDNADDERAFSSIDKLIFADEWRSLICSYNIDNCVWSYIVKKTYLIDAYDKLTDIERLLMLEDFVLIVALSTTDISSVKSIGKNVYGYRVDSGGITNETKSAQKLTSMIVDICISLKTVECLTSASTLYDKEQREQMENRFYREFSWFATKFSCQTSIERLHAIAEFENRNILNYWTELNSRLICKLSHENRKYELNLISKIKAYLHKIRKI